MVIVIGTIVALALVVAVGYLFLTRPSSSSSSGSLSSGDSSSSSSGDQGLRIAGATLAGLAATVSALGAPGQ